MNQVEFEKALDAVPPRKKEVLKLFLMGHSDAEIGEKLVITPNTVARHIAETCKIFGLSNDEGRALLLPIMIYLISLSTTFQRG